MGMEVFIEVVQRAWIRLNIDAKMFSNRRIAVGILFALGLLVYLGPSLFRGVRQTHRNIFNPLDRCLKDRIDPFQVDIDNLDAIYQTEEENDFLNSVGNGYISFETKDNSYLKVRTNRTVSFNVPYRPIYKVYLENKNSEEANILHFTSGTVNTVECFSHSRGSVDVFHQFYAHRTIPYIMIQTIQVTNPTSEEAKATIQKEGGSVWKDWKTSKKVSLTSEGESLDYGTVFGIMDIEKQKQKLVISIASPTFPSHITVKPHSTVTIHAVTGVFYGMFKATPTLANHKDDFENQALSAVSNALSFELRQLRQSHVSAWNDIWTTGLSVSKSKAEGALNGDRINATIYYTLSQVRAPIHEVAIKESKKSALHTQLDYSEGCFSGHDTLQAPKLWSDLKTPTDVQALTNLWLLTLEKRGCNKLVESGADGVLLAMVLSFGGFKFANQHLEFNTHPADLHRDYHFRRISYGNGTHVNVTVAVLSDNRAAIFVALDRSDGHYYACDGGCLDPPVELKNEKVQFPVKLTEPLTAVLYITSDKMHMEELKHAIHVKGVNEAPAHEQHVIAMHKHGHQWGWMPTLFWAGLFLLIILFHLFLFRIIYQEYCLGQLPDRQRFRKFSDF